MQKLVEWSGVEWSGVEWSGVEWSGVSQLKFIKAILNIPIFYMYYYSP